jgi:chromosome partitioning protein
MTKIISIFNQAGGVAKTTLTQNLGYHLTLRNHRVLLVDLDPQASLTCFMGLEPSDLDSTIYNNLIPENEQEEDNLVIINNLFNMDLVPSNILLANAEQELIFAELRELKLKQILEPIQDNYDYILIDCPPSLGILTVISLVASTHVLVPIQCQFKALKGTDSLLATIARIKKRLNRSLKIAGFLPTMYQISNNLDKRTLQSIQEQLKQIAPVFSPLPRATIMAEATEAGQPLAVYCQKYKPLLNLFNDLAEKIEHLS